ncbi:MAG: DUF4277 domain-containing protein [Candidatus Tectomicrobia bacterium]|nr:DUF4277 domain-containing protein [Candidatus Tectomicrobia bacterium]
MSENLTIKTERVDDIPLLLAQLEKMGVAERLNESFPTHGNWQGLSLGDVASVWLCCILSEADHRMNRVEPWALTRLATLHLCLDHVVQREDFTDDRLASILDYLSDDAQWNEFEGALNQRTLRVYDLTRQRVRRDSTTANGSVEVSEDGLFQWRVEQAQHA